MIIFLLLKNYTLKLKNIINYQYYHFLASLIINLEFSIPVAFTISANSDYAVISVSLGLMHNKSNGFPIS